MTAATVDGIVSLRDLLAMTPHDFELDQTPDCWGGRIKSVGDLQDRIRYEDDGTLVLRLPNQYRIEGNRIDDERKLLWWVRHLCGKCWMTTEALGVLIDLVAERNGLVEGAPV